MVLAVLLVIGTVALWYLSGATAAELYKSPDKVPFKEKVNFCLGYGFIAATMIYTLLRLVGMDVGWPHVFLIMPVPVLIYFSIMRAIIRCHQDAQNIA